MAKSLSMSNITWNTRVRSSGSGCTSVAVRTQQFEVGSPLEFDEASQRVSSLEYVNQQVHGGPTGWSEFFNSLEAVVYWKY